VSTITDGNKTEADNVCVGGASDLRTCLSPLNTEKFDEEVMPRQFSRWSRRELMQASKSWRERIEAWSRNFAMLRVSIVKDICCVHRALQIWSDVEKAQ
jgi:hypothetical protein